LKRTNPSVGDSRSLKDKVLAYAESDGQRRSRHKAAFTALLPDIEETLAAGVSIRLVWEYLTQSGEITMVYETFRRLCKDAGLRTANKIKRRAEMAEGTGTAQAQAQAPTPAVGKKPPSRLSPGRFSDDVTRPRADLYDDD